MARKKFYSLKRPKIRASWNRYNLYNLWHQRPQTSIYRQKTFFQQKWAAKSAARAYHGEHVRETQWNRQFSRYIPAVVPMDYKKLAESDGSDLAAGRGSGRTNVTEKEAPSNDRFARTKRNQAKEATGTPYMSDVFWPIEKRLDVAIWRALFASSARQARQFVVHGFVKVNGKKIRYPGYLLNPGDMFSVDPEMVHVATGQHPADPRIPIKAKVEEGEQDLQIDPEEALQNKIAAKKKRNQEQLERKIELNGLRDRIVETIALENPHTTQARDLHEVYMDTFQTGTIRDLRSRVEEVLESVRLRIEEATLGDELDEELPTLASDDVLKERKQLLKDLRKDINDVVAKKKPSGTRKRELRVLYQDVSKALSKVRNFENNNFITAFRSRLQTIEGLVDASEEGLQALPDGSVVSKDGALQFNADGEITEADVPSDAAPTNRITPSRLQIAIRSTMTSPITTLKQQSALENLSRTIDFDVTAEPETLHARFIAIAGPDQAEAALDNVPDTDLSSGADRTPKGVRQAISEHLERVGKLADWQNTSKQAINILPDFAKAWKQVAATIASSTSSAPITSSSGPNIPPPSAFSAPKEDPDADESETSDKKEGPAYITPWRPRPYMSAFAFIPRYLEVNQNVCSAVFLRNPVVRPGAAEVPSPFQPETSQLVFNWYLRRR